MNLENVNKVVFERKHQVDKWGEEHDLQHKNKELLFGALAYLNAAIYGELIGSEDWPFDKESFKYEGRENAIIKSAAMLIAELDRSSLADIVAIAEVKAKFSKEEENIESAPKANKRTKTKK